MGSENRFLVGSGIAPTNKCLEGDSECEPSNSFRKFGVLEETEEICGFPIQVV